MFAMNDLEAFRELKRIAQRHYYSSNNSDRRNYFDKGVDYLTACQGVLHSFFLYKFPKTIVYSTLSYIDQREITNSQTTLIKNNNFPIGYFWNRKLFDDSQIKDAESFFQDFLYRIKKEELISLTDILFERTDYRAPDLIISNSGEKLDEVYCLNSVTGYSEQPICLFQIDTSIIDYVDHFDKSLDSFIDVYIMRNETNSKLNSKIKVKKYFERYAKGIKLFMEMGEQFNNLYFNFIKPFPEGNQYNVLLTISSVATISNSERALINLFLYKIVSYMATDLQTLKAENAELRRKSSLSLGTHKIKTHFTSFILGTKNILFEILRENKWNADELPLVDTLDKELDEVFTLTGVINLIDKFGEDKNELIDTGVKDGLLQEEKPTAIDFNYLLDKINTLNKGKPRIDIDTSSNFNFNNFHFKIYDHYFTNVMLKSFVYTILDNVRQHAEIFIDKDKKDRKYVILKIVHLNGKWIFENSTSHEESWIKNSSELKKGDLGFYSLLFKGSRSGEISMEAKAYKYKIQIINE